MEKYLTSGGKRTADQLDRSQESSVDQTPKRLSHNKSPDKPASGIPTMNQFSGLPVDERDQAGGQHQVPSNSKKKIGSIPPVILEMQPSWTHEAVKNIISEYSKSFHLQYRGNNKVAVHCYSADAHRKVKEGLISLNLLFHTYSRRDEKTPKVVIRGLPANVENDLPKELESLGFDGVKVTRIKTSYTGSFACPPFLVHLRQGADIAKFRKIKYICNCVVEITKYKPKSASITQCYRCQGFGHSSRNCNLPARCVKCTESHTTKECPKVDRKEPAQCCNCKEAHPANYNQCEARQSYMKRLQDRRDAQKKTLTMQFGPKPNSAIKGRTWSEVASNVPLTSNRREPVTRTQASVSDPPLLSNHDDTTRDMLQILTIVKSLKEKFLGCTTMVDKVILVLKHLGDYV